MKKEIISIGEGINLKFDGKGNVVGKYYGKCPLCKSNNNLVHQNKSKWVCYKCRYK